MTVKTYVGTYAGEVFSLEIDTSSGRLSQPSTAAKLDAPSYCAVADAKYLLVCSETERTGENYGGGLVSFEILSDGSLSKLSRVCTLGTYPCHVAFDPVTRQAAVANYGDGSFAVCRLGTDGVLSDPHILVRHEGCGPDKSRQEGPHAHQCVFRDDGSMWVLDLGLDAAVQYTFEGEGVRELRRLHAPAGSGARHIAFDKTGEYAYVLCEMGSLIAAYDISSSGEKDPSEVYMLTDGTPGRTGAAAIRYRDDGLLLATNRFKDSLSLYRANGTSLELCDSTVCGKTPRDAAFVPGTDMVIAGFQDDDRAALYDISSGKLEKIDEIYLPRPTCFVFA